MNCSKDRPTPEPDPVNDRASHIPSAKTTAAHIAVISIQFLLVLLIYLPAILAGRPDFRNTYTAGYMVRAGHGHAIYDANVQKEFQNAVVSKTARPIPFIRPAYQALFYVPFSFLPFRYAYFVFLAFNLSLLLVCLLLLHPYMSNLRHIFFGLPSMMFLFFPVTVALMQGQDSIILLTLLVVAYTCIQRKREYAAGALVALGLFKLQLILPILLLFLLWRRWRFVTSFILTAAALGCVSVWIVGGAGSIHFLQLLIGIGSKFSLRAGPPLFMNLMANLHGAIQVILKGSYLVLPVTAAASAVTLLLVAYRRQAGAHALLVAISTGALVSYYMYPHDLCIMVLPIAVMLDHLAGTGNEKLPYRRAQIVTAALLLVAPTLLIFALHQFWIASLPLLAFVFMISAYQADTAGWGARVSPGV